MHGALPASSLQLAPPESSSGCVWLWSGVNQQPLQAWQRGSVAIAYPLGEGPIKAPLALAMPLPKGNYTHPHTHFCWSTLPKHLKNQRRYPCLPLSVLSSHRYCDLKKRTVLGARSPLFFCRDLLRRHEVVQPWHTFPRELVFQLCSFSPELRFRQGCAHQKVLEEQLWYSFPTWVSVIPNAVLKVTWLPSKYCVTLLSILIQISD